LPNNNIFFFTKMTLGSFNGIGVSAVPLFAQRLLVNATTGKKRAPQHIA
jgi:hypothetical protein